MTNTAKHAHLTLVGQITSAEVDAKKTGDFSKYKSLCDLANAARDLLEAATRGREACQILANECRDQDDEKFAAIWQKKADFCDAAIKKARGK